MSDQIKKGDIPHIGVRGQCGLLIDWKMADGSPAPHDYTEGFNAENFFNEQEKYLGPDVNGCEPVFRDMTPEEAKEYLAPDIAFGRGMSNEPEKELTREEAFLLFRNHILTPHLASSLSGWMKGVIETDRSTSAFDAVVSFTRHHQDLIRECSVRR